MNLAVIKMGVTLLLCLLCWSCAQLQVAAQEDPSQSNAIPNDLPKTRQRMSTNENHKPMFDNCAKYAPEVDEDQPKGTFVIKVHATDQDSADTPDGKITYGIEKIPGTRDYFRIDNTTGEIFTLVPFDRDEPISQKEFYISVRAEDNGWPQLADMCTFKVTVRDINDNPPSFDKAEYVSQVSEDLPENSEVLRVSAYDFDNGENSRLTYRFGSSTGPNVLDDYFRIDPNTGVVYLKKKLIGKRLVNFTSTVIVQDNGVPPLSATVDVSFKVVDSGKNPPTIKVIDGQQTITLQENENDFKRALVVITADSNMADKEIAFELVKGKTAQTNKDQTFILKPDGQTANILLARHLDYETVTEYQLIVRAKNKDFLESSTIINVKVEDVNDEVPTFVELLKGSVVENSAPGAQAMTVRAIDKDGTSPNNLVVYELVTHRDKFDIDPNTGVITAKQEFDREAEAVYHVNVRANDSAPSALTGDGKPNSVDQTFQISIEDVNDNQPKFTRALYEVFNISESLDTNKDVIEVKAEDADSASVITYRITEGDDDHTFYMEASTGRIKVQKKLDYEKVESYNLTVEADDGIYNDTAKVVIHILNENDEIPVFEAFDKDIFIEEEKPSAGCIIQLTAYDPDIKDRNADQKIVYEVSKQYQPYLSVTPDGCVTVTKALDRDPPHGTPTRQAFINAYDDNRGPNSKFASAEIDIHLQDINDNAPYLNKTEVVWYENEEPGLIITLTAEDNDDHEAGNGPPFTFEMADSAYDLFDKFSIGTQGDLHAQVEFDREKKKYYDIPIKITDGGTPPQSGISTLRVIIGDRNDNAAQDGSSEIFVYKYERLSVESNIGRVYVNDPDDWDLPDKVFQWRSIGSDYFTLQPNGSIIMSPNVNPDVYNFEFNVRERLPNGTEHEVSAHVKVTVKAIPEEAVRKSGSIRLKGATIEDIIEKDPMTQTSKKDKLQEHLSKILNTSLENVDVFTVITSPSNSSFVDVRFSAHGSPYYAPEKLNNRATQNQDELERELGVEFVMISINECLYENNCTKSCSNVLNIKEEPAAVFTNKTSFVGVKAVTEADCKCQEHLAQKECFNGGTPIEDGQCNCPEGFTGPNCELLSISFRGNGWAMYQPLDSCEQIQITLVILPHTENGLIFYAGPATQRDAALSNNFISLEVREGWLVFKINLGDRTEELKSDYKKISGGNKYDIRIGINFILNEMQIEVDECSSDCLRLQAVMGKGPLRLNGPLLLGGRPNHFMSQEHAKGIWGNPPTDQGFVGCISNFTYNSFIYNLGAPSDKYEAQEGCNYATYQAATFGVDSNFLVAILVCIAILLILLLAVVVHKRKQDNFNEKEMDDTRENIINYEDEGGGECDTNFDLSVLRDNITEKPPLKDNLYGRAPDVPADIGSFLDDKKRSCDKDTLPYDDVRHYAYEGDGNSTGSLSSLASCTDEGDLKFNYLSSFGPRFRKLADMYGDDASEEGSQNEESWC